MNKAELVAELAKRSGKTKKDSEALVTSVFDIITETLKAGDKVQIMGFGTFEVRERAAHMGINPSTKEEIEIPASKAPAFKAGAGLKKLINE